MTVIVRAVPLGGVGTPLPPGDPTAGESQRAAAFADPQRAHEFLAGRLALRAFVAGELGVEPARVRPAYRCPACGPGEHGTPGFALGSDDGGADDGGSDHGGTDDGAFARPLDVAASLSRAGGWALLAVELPPAGGRWEAGVGDPLPAIGVDLALVADFRRAVPDAAYSPAERRRLLSVPDVPAEAARLWARKEALLKALGTGLRTDPAAVETLEDGRVDGVDTRALGLPPGFVAAVSVTSAPAISEAAEASRRRARGGAR
ncbi:4'-phosphopantetheinyl transferase family protein [Sinomonas sp. P47F7]|uniref:4'-phosphopantetheinyl transferase family protein n=1 Tax=Sinomonas sp. P47F7 TaxID=3410987 RepID=UPI003BF5E555